MESTNETGTEEEGIDCVQELSIRERSNALQIPNPRQNSIKEAKSIPEIHAPDDPDEAATEIKSSSPFTAIDVDSSGNFREKSLRLLPAQGQLQVLMTGWATKESGQAYFGKHNWRRRWFCLSITDERLILTYSEKINSAEPKGVVVLSQDYSARELEKEVKGKQNCFALGPVLDKSALRTYYISCDTEDQRLEWIVMINSAIEGVPEKALKRKSTYRIKKRKRVVTRVHSDPLITSNDSNSFLLHSWRMNQWVQVCDAAKSINWKRSETKDGVSVCRQSFKDTEIVAVKMEGIINSPLDVTFEYMQRSVKPGGKFDFAFRKEELIQKIEEKFTTVYITRNVYNVPLPGMKKRDVCLLRTWLSTNITKDKTCGLLLCSVSHPEAPKCKEYERASVFPSGIILQPNDNEENGDSTKLTAVFQIDLKDTLQNMLRGSYKSGVFRTGLRNFFHHLRGLVHSYNDLIQI